MSKMPPFDRAILWYGIVMAGMGGLVGTWVDTGETPPAPEPETIRVVDIRKHEVEVPVPTLPSSCQMAIEQAIAIAEQADEVSAAAGAQVDILDAANQSIADGDMDTLNDLVQQQRDLMREYAHWQVPMAEANPMDTPTPEHGDLVEVPQSIQTQLDICQEDLS